MFNEEGIVNKLVTAAVIGLLGWNVMTTQRLAIDVAVISEKVDANASGVEIVVLQAQIQQLEKRIEHVEDRTEENF